ncbi:MAG TPA: aminoglycoside phosphotransferase family protein [Candidatus Limnocylindrales bacterium]
MSDPVAPSLEALLARHGLADAVERPLAHDGWSGAAITSLEAADGSRYVVKRDSPARDWIARATADATLREGQLVARRPSLGWILPHLGVAHDGPDGIALLMPDLTGQLFRWERPIDGVALARVIAALAQLHAAGATGPPAALDDVPWCPVRERLLLLSRPAAEGYARAGDAVGTRFLAGWDAFERVAAGVAPAAIDLVDRLSADPSPLLAALAGRPSTVLHGDLKLGNLGFDRAGRPLAIDWQMVMLAPRAVDLGWFLVSNTTDLPAPPAEVIVHYAGAAGWSAADRAAEGDLAVLVGLLLRGWRKGLDAEASVVHASGVTALDDLTWWCREAVAAADRRL